MKVLNLTVAISDDEYANDSHVRDALAETLRALEDAGIVVGFSFDRGKNAPRVVSRQGDRIPV